jgi:hypothetical protein
MWSKNRSSFLRPLKNKGFKEEIVTKIGVYDILKSTPLESNKSQFTNLVDSCPLLVIYHFGISCHLAW